MGCDIHAYPEVLRDGQWRPITHLPREVFDAVHPTIMPIEEWDLKFKAEWYEDFNSDKYTGRSDERHRWPVQRNYYLFTVLAGVRAYEHAHDQVYPVRGLPDDVSPEVMEHVEAWRIDSHDHSWLTLRELYDERVAASEPRGWAVWLRALTDIAEGNLDNVRVVFFFDN
jgi:hypothetical protein